MSLRLGKVSRGQIMKTHKSGKGGWTLSCKHWGTICFKAAFKGFKLRRAMVRFAFRKITLVAKAEKEVESITLEQGRPVRLLGILSGTSL